MGRKEINRNHLLITVISPAVGLYYAIKSRQWNSKKWIIILIITLFGALFPVSRQGEGPKGSDAGFLLEIAYIHYSDISFGQWVYELVEIMKLSPEPGGYQYVAMHLLGYFLSLLGIPGALFTFVGFIFGFFYVNSLSKILVWRHKPYLSFIGVSLIGLLIIYIGVDHMQSIRTWTGAWILFYGVFRFHQTGKKKYIGLILIAVLFHFAYLFIALPAILVMFVRRIPSLILVFAFGLSFFVNLNPGGVLENIKTSDWGESKVQTYYHEGEGDVQFDILLRDDNRNFYTKYGKFQSALWGANFLAFTLILTGHYKKTNLTSLEYGLLATGLCMATMANLTDFVVPFYRRAMGNAGLYIIATTVLLILRGKLLPKGRPNLFWRQLMLVISLIIFIPFVIYTISNMLLYTSIFLFASPLLGIIGGEVTNISIRELIGWFT